MQLGKHECKLLKFLITYGNGKDSWHTIQSDTLRVARSLETKGFVVMNQHNQARLNINTN